MFLEPRLKSLVSAKDPPTPPIRQSKSLVNQTGQSKTLIFRRRFAPDSLYGVYFIKMPELPQPVISVSSHESELSSRYQFNDFVWRRGQADILKCLRIKDRPRSFSTSKSAKIGLACGANIAAERQTTQSHRSTS